MKKTLILCLLLVMVSAASASCGRPAEAYITVRFGFPLAGIGTHPNGIMGVAIADGYVERYLNAVGYTLEVRPFLGAAPAINQALADGELDFVEYFGFPAVLSKAGGLEHRLISVTRWVAQWVLVAGADSGIETIYDLAGKTVAYMDGTATHLYLMRVLDEAGISSDEIIHVNDISVIEGLSGAAIGRFDATVVIDGQQTAFKEDGAVRVIHRGSSADEDVFNEPGVLIACGEFYAAHPDAAPAIQKALLRARESGQRDVPAFYRTIAEIIGLDFDTLISSANFDLNVRYPLNLDDRYISALADILTFLRYNGFTDGDIDFDEWHGGGRAVRLAADYFFNE